MANQYFHFPTSTTNYKLPSGDTLRFRLWYDDGTAESNTNTNAALIKVDPLEIPLEVTPSDQTFRFSKMGFVFENTADVFDGTILDEIYDNDTYMEVYLNGSLYFYGLVDFSSIKRSSWYVVGGSLKFRQIKFNIFDILSYYWTRSVTFSDVSITTPDALDDILELIFADVGISAGSVNVDTNIGWTEYSGGTTYNLSNLNLDVVVSTTQCRDYLKFIMLYFGTFIYYLNGKMNIVSRKLGTTKTITNLDLVQPIEKIQNQDIIEYLRVRITGGSLIDAPIPSVETTSDVISFSAGTDNGNTAKNFDIGPETTFGNLIYSTSTSTRHPSAGNDGMTGGSETTLIDTGMTFQVDYWECGDYVYNASNGEGAIVYNVDSETQVTHSELSSANQNTDLWYGYKGGDDFNKRFKFYKITEAALEVYDEFFMTSNDILKITVHDLTDFDDIEKRYVILSANHRAKKAKIDFEQDEIDLELRQIT